MASREEQGGSSYVYFQSVSAHVYHGSLALLTVSFPLVRIVGGITHIVSEQNPSNVTLQIVFATLEGAGVSPLLLATLGFLQTV